MMNTCKLLVKFIQKHESNKAITLKDTTSQFSFHSDRCFTIKISHPLHYFVLIFSHFIENPVNNTSTEFQ